MRPSVGFNSSKFPSLDEMALYNHYHAKIIRNVL